MQMRLLITGGAGCLGSNLFEHYLPLGHEICIIDNFQTSSKKIIPRNSRLQVVEGSIADIELVKNAFLNFKPTHVIHSAASYKDPKNYIEDTNTNVLGSIYVAKYAAEMEVMRFVNLQTALCYGIPKVLPIPINHPVAPFTSYGISKTAGEAYLINSKLPVVSLRLANICAPRLAIGPIPNFYKRLKENEDCFCSHTVRDFLDISDFLLLMDRILMENFSPGIFNVSTGKGHSIIEVFEIVANYLGIKVSSIPIASHNKEDVPKVILDPSLTEKTFNWKAKVGFENTILNQLHWYEQHGVNNIYSHFNEKKD